MISEKYQVFDLITYSLSVSDPFSSNSCDYFMSFFCVNFYLVFGLIAQHIFRNRFALFSSYLKMFRV